MKQFFAWLKWKLRGCYTISYTGYNCGLCGKWVRDPFSIPTYKSCGSWWDTWGICKECLNLKEVDYSTAEWNENGIPNLQKGRKRS